MTYPEHINYDSDDENAFLTATTTKKLKIVILISIIIMTI